MDEVVQIGTAVQALEDDTEGCNDRGDDSMAPDALRMPPASCGSIPTRTPLRTRPVRLKRSRSSATGRHAAGEPVLGCFRAGRAFRFMPVRSRQGDDAGLVGRHGGQGGRLSAAGVVVSVREPMAYRGHPGSWAATTNGRSRPFCRTRKRRCLACGLVEQRCKRDDDEADAWSP